MLLGKAKGWDPSLLILTMNKYLDGLNSLILERQPVYEKENSEFKPSVTLLEIATLYHILP